MVETRMDVMISRAMAQSQPINNRPRQPAREQVVQARPAEGARSVETDIARIFAKRAFQAAPSTEIAFTPARVVLQDFTGVPSSSTVQAPQCVVSQPICVPVIRRSSRIKCTKRQRGSTSPSFSFPFMVT